MRVLHWLASVARSSTNCIVPPDVSRKRTAEVVPFSTVPVTEVPETVPTDDPDEAAVEEPPASEIESACM